jgi:hypothetical protein
MSGLPDMRKEAPRQRGIGRPTRRLFKQYGRRSSPFRDEVSPFRSHVRCSKYCVEFAAQFFDFSQGEASLECVCVIDGTGQCRSAQMLL